MEKSPTYCCKMQDDDDDNYHGYNEDDNDDYLARGELITMIKTIMIIM